jgi:hypothetical protein
LDALSGAQLLFVATFRDWVIIVSGIAIAAFFLGALIVTLVLGMLMRALLKKLSALVDERVSPLLDTAKQSAEEVRGTTKYVSQAAVTPIVRTYGVVAGVRRAASVLSGLAGASTDGEKRKP